MNKILQQVLLIFLGGSLLLVAAWCSFQVYKNSSARAKIKVDYSEINSLSYGLLSVNVWKDHLTTIAMNRINDFELTQKQEDTLKFEVTQLLNAAVNKADSLLNQKQKTIKAKLAKFAVKTFVNEEKVRALVPVFSETIVEEIQDPKNKETLKYLVRSKVEEYSQLTQASTSEMAAIDSILNIYSATNVQEFNQYSEDSLGYLQDQTYFYTYIALGVVLVFLILWWILKKQKTVHTPLFIISVLVALVILAAGLTAPMIEIDARFREVNFLLIGEKISFKDQVIFFQSKSIVDVVIILFETKKIDSIIVGALILLFSIIFPIAKLFSAQIYLLGREGIRNNRLINFFAFKSGKWSMADVYVIAIFMAYIGFQGILENQLSFLNVRTESLMSISTNETSLQPGFLLFIGFVLFSLLLSVILKYITALEKIKNSESVSEAVA